MEGGGREHTKASRAERANVSCLPGTPPLCPLPQPPPNTRAEVSLLLWRLKGFRIPISPNNQHTKRRRRRIRRKRRQSRERESSRACACTHAVRIGGVVQSPRRSGRTALAKPGRRSAAGATESYAATGFRRKMTRARVGGVGHAAPELTALGRCRFH